MEHSLLVAKELLFWIFWGWKIRSFLSQNVDKNMILITEKFLFWTFWEWETRSFFETKSLCKDDIYWLLKCCCFELCRDGKYSLFRDKKVNGKMIFTDYWKVLVLSFSVMGNMVFFSQKVDVKVIFTWS